MGADFEIKIHWKESIIEVVYPEFVDEEVFRRYERKIRDAIGKMHGSAWSCLVDQTSMAVLPPEFADQIAALNQWAIKNGMKRAARVVRPSAIAEWQARSVLRKSGIDQAAAVYASRADAWAALTAAAATAPAAKK